MELTVLLAAVGCESDPRQGEVLRRVMGYTAARQMTVIHGFSRASPGGSEIDFCPGEVYLVRLTASYTVPARTPGRSVEVHDIEVVAKLTMSNEHPPTGFRVRGVWAGAVSFVTEDDDGPRDDLRQRDRP